jgi:hypothetical protein
VFAPVEKFFLQPEATGGAQLWIVPMGEAKGAAIRIVEEESAR